MRRLPFHRLLWLYVAFLVAAVALSVLSASNSDARATRAAAHQIVNPP
jgi:hypothetical protein